MRATFCDEQSSDTGIHLYTAGVFEVAPGEFVRRAAQRAIDVLVEVEESDFSTSHHFKTRHIEATASSSQDIKGLQIPTRLYLCHARPYQPPLGFQSADIAYPRLRLSASDDGAPVRIERGEKLGAWVASK
jgi:hypothetical protein